MAVLFGGMMPAGVVGSVLGVLVMLIILLFGHGINLILCGLTGFIHALRLCFVEFLFKFYEGGGKAYSPFRLKSRVVIPVAEKS
ncbi:MAG: hypothetical protein J7L90_03320, partial [Dehalococcoidia bacterium]|nr:hypothetical protein [Dehalococcoidia bacterium]